MIRKGFKFNVGDIITSYGRNLKIIKRGYRETSQGRVKEYHYKCLNCGNEDKIVEYSLDGAQHCGCNACCKSARKLTKGINDIPTTANWMVKYFPGGEEQASQYLKYSRAIIDFVCPDCGRIVSKPIYNVMANKGISCVCGDSKSYPNKYMFFLLESLNIPFETEKNFQWLRNRFYDFYFKIDDKEYIIEMNGMQHYGRPIKKNDRYRKPEEELENDSIKEKTAIKNGIDFYYTIDCKKSDPLYIKNSIISSELLNKLGIDYKDVDWLYCEQSASSNFVKIVCEYFSKNPKLSVKKVAEHFKIQPAYAGKYLHTGNKYGWCKFDEETKRLHCKLTQRYRVKPIYCCDRDLYFDSPETLIEKLSTPDSQLFSRQIRQSIQRGHTYKGHKFLHITQNDFNLAKRYSPEKVYGEYFDIIEDKGETHDKRMPNNN